MKIGLAQIRSGKAEVGSNLQKHMEMISVAADHKVDAVFFPELSVTGYEPTLADELGLDADFSLFDEVQATCDSRSILAGLGMPVRNERGVQIAMVIIAPGRPIQTYSKQLLHADEMPYFVEGRGQLLLEMHDQKIAPAICYESLQSEHAGAAADMGATVYLASVAKSATGVARAKVQYPEFARRYSMPVLMVNAVGWCDNFMSVGQSGIWTAPEGQCLAQLGDTEALLVYDTTDQLVTIIEHFT